MMHPIIDNLLQSLRPNIMHVLRMVCEFMKVCMTIYWPNQGSISWVVLEFVTSTRMDTSHSFDV